ncbi:MAG: ABC transporter ATP-binding protein, partial [Candidatus Tumulicola sp.]
MNGTLVTADHVSKVFCTSGEDVSAVRDASCTVPSAARIALLGPSGSGKSTLLQLLGGLDIPTGGTVTWPAFGPDVRPRNVAFVFQNQTLIPALSVLENVELPLQLQGASDRGARERARAALERLGLRALSDKLPEELSGGQAQRVSFARALVGEPRLI